MKNKFPNENLHRNVSYLFSVQKVIWMLCKPFPFYYFPFYKFYNLIKLLNK